MDNLYLVAAIGRSGELGLDNHLIWRIKEDLSFYRQVTYGKNIIMGRKTFESMPPKALEGRNIFVLSSKELDKHYDVNSFTNIESLIEYIKLHNDEFFIVVGGSQVYEELLPYVSSMYLTEIDENAEADTFFPYFDESEFDINTIYKNNKIEYLDNEEIPYVRNWYIRKRVK